MDIILQLGGNTSRAAKAAKLAVQNPKALVVISSEIGDHGLSFYDAAGVNRDRITIDMQAWDTVTNFTHTYKLLCRLSITRLLVITDSSHMPRSLAIAEQVWGGRVPIEGHNFDDGNAYLKRDLTNLKTDKWRAWLWRWFGILVYYKSVYDARSQYYKQIETHSLIEINI
jgi:uncharacterized SAM-binding protein YcdF (DUF218 family)